MLIKSVKSLVHPENLQSFCDEIKMPAEVKYKVVQNFDSLDFEPITEAFNGLFSIDTGKEASDVINTYYGQNQNGLMVLTVYLTAAVIAREEYKKQSISDIIYIDTMKIFSRFVGEYLKSFGKYGFDRGWWTYRNVSLTLFRLGELEFEMCSLTEDKSEIITEGTPVISVHIPSDAKITRNELNRSYSMAKNFFKEYFGGYDYKFICCSSWLLSPALKDLLPSSSKILDFQRDYEIVSFDENNKNFMEWVYKKEYDDYNMLTENTSLERNIKKHLLTGGKIGNAFGIFYNDFLFNSEVI